MSASVQTCSHKHVTRGNAGMETPKKENKIGNTTIIIHSPLVVMTSEERKQWFKDEWEKGNPILMQIADAVEACYT
jgi:hypothetical protein